MKILLKTIKILNLILLIVLICFGIFLLNGVFEYFVVQDKIAEFKARAVEEPEIDPNRADMYYYRIKATEDEDTSRNVFDKQKRYIGSKGDVVTSNRNPLREYPLLSKLVGPFAKYLYLGHTNIIITDDGSQVVETIGNSAWENNIVRKNRNDWLTSEEGVNNKYSSPMIIGLRVKDTTAEQRDLMAEYALSKVGYRYNYSFLFNRANTFYCTDVASRAVAAGGTNINYDFLATTGTDLITSNNVYIIFIREVVVENGVERYNFYYLE